MAETKFVFYEAFKGRILTFIIFDTVVQICQNNYKGRYNNMPKIPTEYEYAWYILRYILSCTN